MEGKLKYLLLQTVKNQNCEDGVEVGQLSHLARKWIKIRSVICFEMVRDWRVERERLLWFTGASSRRGRL